MTSKMLLNYHVHVAQDMSGYCCRPTWQRETNMVAIYFTTCSRDNFVYVF